MYFGGQPFVGCRIGKKFFPVCGLPFGLVQCVLCLTEASKFEEAHLLIVDLSVCVTGVEFRKLSPVPIC